MALFVYRILTVLHICCSLRRLKTRPHFTPFSGRTVSSVTVQCNHHISARAVDYFWQQCVFWFSSPVCFDTFFFFFFFFQFRAVCVCSSEHVCEKYDGAVSGGYRQPVWISKEERCASLCSCVLTRSSLQICPLYFTDRKNPELLPNILSTCLF